ncbi:cellulose synthase/poly-beta-1,6-N-acetylglucosamine synthase-like glycosyltransferase [Mucilaginibacter yixingensis]|uniref:Cellulose synthase/poly-beta-1,6-N-acetylglucosamine synthase-like glycosyltransferase n=1 Tax=Mucilaginibacter yixingensis TaxID=1295612 RepID=A0A2T5JET2_9SPHI|nr:glycosyltransferase family 2 protein [Mucilaginibacter yixingensis]PTR00947.1 cellulose synthase/poly-beta-1,6-N-acetylglucosamine synthase-like glycosyltransferase [Mucilaginibacter yixingensis]
MKITFWISLFMAFYTYLGYGILLYIIIKIKRAVKGKRPVPVVNADTLPDCTLVVAAYNEAGIIREKIENSLALDYPAGKYKLLFVTDGSSDNTPDIIAEYPQIKLLHKSGRSGKIAAVHRAMEFVDTEIVIFTDANTMLNKEALVNICRHYSDTTVGAVAGEKRVKIEETDDASAAGEGFYWKYESTLKKWDSELYSVVGAAGELFSVRRSLYKPVQPNALLDDFMISMLIAADGYRIVYEPDAYATESSSENVSEELKRKVRIASGGIQSIIWLKKLLNPFKYPMLSFQYVSHRVLRWTVTPFFMILSLITNIAIVAGPGGWIYQLLLAGQVLFYLLALLGMIMEKRQIRVKALFVPYYFCVMNYAVLAGIIRYFTTTQTGVWEKAQRKVG